MAARKKAPAKAAPTGKLPEGYRKLNAGYAPSWEPDVGDILEGEVKSIREVEVKRGRKTITTRVMEVETEAGESFTVWEAAMLSELFAEAQVGAQVFILFEGISDKAKPGQNPAKLYTCGISDAPF